MDENGNGNTKEIPCILNDKGNNNYELECTLTNSISAHLNNTDAKISEDKYLVISINDEVNDFISFNIPINKYNNAKSSNNRLSGGAIAAIIVSCVVAGLAVTIIALLLKEQKLNAIHPRIQRSSMEIYGSSSNIKDKE